MGEKQLNYNTPLLSARRFGAASENKGSRKNYNYKCSLPSFTLSGPVRTPGTVPFSWEQSPGNPKDETATVTAIKCDSSENVLEDPCDDYGKNNEGGGDIDYFGDNESFLGKACGLFPRFSSNDFFTMSAKSPYICARDTAENEDQNLTTKYIQLEAPKLSEKSRKNENQWSAKADNEEFRPAKFSQFPLPVPPPSPQCPSDSWLHRTLPSASSRYLNTRSFLGTRVHPRTQGVKITILVPNSETNVKTYKDSLKPIPEI